MWKWSIVGLLVPEISVFLLIFARMPQKPASAPIEITRSDLFASKGWTSKDVAVLGFHLGMGRMDAFKVAQGYQLSLDDASGQGCLTAATCNIFDLGRYIGFNLEFGESSDAVNTMVIESPAWDVPQEERSVWLVRKLQGETRRLFDDYSDNLRAQLLGKPDSYWGSANPKQYPRLSLRVNGYEYKRLGLILHIARKQPPGGDALAQEGNLTVEFMLPGSRR